MSYKLNSTKRDPRRQCRGKVRQTNRMNAEVARTKQQEATGDPELALYQCPHCRGFHVGHPHAARRRQLREHRLLKLIELGMKRTLKYSKSSSSHTEKQGGGK